MEFTAAQDGLRVDVFLAGCLPELTRSAVQRLLAEGGVTCGGAPVRKNARTEAGAVYAVTLPEARPVETAAQDIPLDIVYEDGDVLVINKPKGLVVHPAAGHEDGTLVNALLYHCGDSLSGVGGERRPGIVHRIDRDTTGLLIVAKNDFAHRRLAAQLSDHTLRRTYECIVRGGFREDSGTVNTPIGRDPRDRKRMAVTEKNSREAVTHWEVIALRAVYSPALPPRDRPHAPDSRAHGVDPPPHRGRPRLRHRQAGAWPAFAVPPREGADVPAPPHRRGDDALLPPAGGV